MLDFHGKGDLIEYDGGYREVRPADYENSDCWMTDDSEAVQGDLGLSGLLPLRSEVQY